MAVIPFTGVTKLDMDPDRVLSEAMEKLDEAVVIGFSKCGDFYFASSIADGGDVLWLLELGKKRLLERAEELAGE